MTVLIAILSACAWSLFDLKRKLLVSNLSPLTLAMWLSIWVIPVYLGLWWTVDAAWPSAVYWWPAAGSLFVSSVATIAFISALKVGQIALLMPVLALTPVVSAILSVWWLNEALSPAELSAIAAIVILLFFLHGGARFRWRAGTGYMLIVALGWGSGIVFDRWALVHAHPFSHAALQSIGMLLLFLLLLSGRGQLRQALATSELPLKHIALAASLFVLAVSTQLVALQELHAGIIESIKRGIGTLGALVWGVYIFKEPVTRHQVVLVCLLIAAIAWLVWP